MKLARRFRRLVKLGYEVKQECGMRFIAFGDSHVRPLQKVLVNGRPIGTHWVGPKLMFSVARDGVYRVCNGEANDLREDDVITYSFGEIDARCHILKHATFGKHHKIVNDLVRAYVAALTEAPGRPIVLAPPPTTTIPVPKDFPFPFLGAEQERVEVLRCMWEALERECRASDVSLIQLHPFVQNTDGTLRAEYSDGNVHVQEDIAATVIAHRLQAMFPRLRVGARVPVDFSGASRRHTDVVDEGPGNRRDNAADGRRPEAVA